MITEQMLEGICTAMDWYSLRQAGDFESAGNDLFIFQDDMDDESQSLTGSQLQGAMLSKLSDMGRCYQINHNPGMTPHYYGVETWPAGDCRRKQYNHDTTMLEAVAKALIQAAST